MITHDDYTYTACLAGVESQEALLAVLSRAYRKKLNASDIRHDYVIAQWEKVIVQVQVLRVYLDQ